MKSPYPTTIPQPPQAPLAASAQEENDSINLLDMLDVVLDSKMLIAVVTAATLALGAAYVLLATPIYEADTLVQVEDTKGDPLGMRGDANFFDIKSPATAEIEILRSRLVMGQAVQNLQYELAVTPKYVPLIGRWLSRRATAPSEPGFLGMAGYVRGNEKLRVPRFAPPKAGVDEDFVVTLLPGQSGYALTGPDGENLGQARVGAPLSFKLEGQAGELLVAEAVGKAGAQFYIKARSVLEVTQQLQKDVKIAEQGKQSGVLRVSLESSRPARAAAMLNEIGTLYVRQNTERKAAEAEKSINFLNTQLPQLKADLEASEQKFNQFRTQQGTFDLDEEAKALLVRGTGLKLKLLEATQKRNELGVRFTNQHPAAQAIDAEIADIHKQLSELEGKAKTFPAVEQDLLRLTREVKVNKELYTNLVNSLQQLRLVKEGKVGNVRIVDPAAVPERPVKPRRALMLALAGVLGLLGGLGLAFLRNSMRSGIRHAEALEQELGLNVFATIPHAMAQVALSQDISAKKPGIHVLASLKPDEPAIESLRSLRTALQFAMLDAPNKIVLITGPTPGIGKSFTTTNFAAVLATAGKRVLLIDADLRKGHIHQFFGLPRGVGLSELISGTQSLDAVLHRQLLPNVDFVATGAMPPNPAELLMSGATARLLGELNQLYDIVLIDTPPVLAVADTAVLAPQAGTVFLVTRAEVTSMGEVQESIKRLAQAGVAVKGAIFNGLDISKRRYGDGYGYGSGYGNGSGYKYKRYGYRYRSYGYQAGKTP